MGESPSAGWMELFNAFVGQLKGEVAPPAAAAGQPTVLAMPLEGPGMGRPVYAKVANIRGRKIVLEWPTPNAMVRRFSVRLPTGGNQASWVECAAPSGSSEAEAVKVSCDHANACPAWVFMETGKMSSCSHAGHDGCHQTGKVGSELKKVMGQ